jgi:hypothetical protein
MPTWDPAAVRVSEENRSWGHDWIVGALANLGILFGERSLRMPH